MAGESVYTQIWIAVYSAYVVAQSVEEWRRTGEPGAYVGNEDRFAEEAATVAELAVEAERRRRAAMLAPMAAAVPVEMISDGARPLVEVGDVVTWKAGSQPEQGAPITINASFWNQAEVAATLTSIRRGGVLIWSVDPVDPIVGQQGQREIREGLKAMIDAAHDAAVVDHVGERWYCDECGHEHEGPRLAGICIGCSCTRTRPKA